MNTTAIDKFSLFSFQILKRTLRNYVYLSWLAINNQSSPYQLIKDKKLTKNTKFFLKGLMNMIGWAERGPKEE